MVCFLGTVDSLPLKGDLLGILEVTYNVMFAIGPKQQSETIRMVAASLVKRSSDAHNPQLMTLSRNEGVSA